MVETGPEQAQLIEHLVGSTLSSIVKAQGLAASQLIEIIETIGFEPGDEDQPMRTRTFSFEFFRSEIDETTDTLVRKKVTATLPLLTVLNLPAIAIEEATVQMELRLVAGEEAPEPSVRTTPRTLPQLGPAPLRMYAVPAKKKLVRSEKEVVAIDAAGTIKINVTLRQQSPLGLEKIQSLLDGAHEEQSENES